jgi:hypothetical protein
MVHRSASRDSWNREAGSRLSPGILVATAVLFLTAIPVSARAQNRADLQVAARVLATAPSREGVDLIALAVTGAKRSDAPLATVTVDRSLLPTAADSVAERPRVVVVVAFLRN